MNMLSCLLLSFLLLQLVVVESQNDTSFALNAFTPHSLLVTYERNAHVPPDQTFARLVPAYGTGAPTSSGVGRVLYTAPVKLWERGKQISFETTITQRITPYRSSVIYGWTFFIIPVNSTTATGGTVANLGIYNTLKPGSAYVTVEVDLSISPDYDPNYTHVGININSPRSQNHTRFQYSASQLVTARITYDAPTRLISANVTYGSTTALVSFHYNLRDLLPNQVQFGLSAATATSTSAAYFDFYTWHFNSTMGPDSNRIIQEDTPTYINKFLM